MKKILLFVMSLFVMTSAFADAVEGTLDFDKDSLLWDIPTTGTAGQNFEATDGVNKINVTCEGTNKAYYFKYTYGTPVYHALFYGKSGAQVSTSVSYNVSRIIVTGGAGASAKTSFDIYAGDTKIGTHTSSKDEYSIDVPSGNQAAGTVYSIKVTNANNAQIVKIVLEKAVSGAPETPKASVASGTYLSAQSVELTCETEGADIYYTVDGTDPTSTSTKYASAISISETTTLKAIAIKNDISSKVATFEYAIPELSGTGTKEDPFSVADVIALNNGLADTCWVMGIVYGYYENNKPVEYVDSAVVSNIALTDGTNYIPVQLPSGDVRTALNLYDNPGMCGATVKVYGVLQSYFSTTGVKNTSDYVVIKTTAINAVENKFDENAPVYNLAGQRVSANTKGILIQNGKKFINK